MFFNSINEKQEDLNSDNNGKPSYAENFNFTIEYSTTSCQG